MTSATPTDSPARSRGRCCCGTPTSPSPARSTTLRTNTEPSKLNLGRDPARPVALVYVDDGTSTFSVSQSSTGVFDDSSCRGESSGVGQAAAGSRRSKDSHGRPLLLEVLAVGPGPVLDADTKFLEVLPRASRIRSPSTTAPVAGSCGGSSDNTQDDNALRMPGEVIVGFPPGVEPVIGARDLVAGRNNDAEIYRSACTVR